MSKTTASGLANVAEDLSFIRTVAGNPPGQDTEATYSVSRFVTPVAWGLFGILSASPTQADYDWLEPFFAEDWHYSAYVDLSYPANFNTSDPHPWRSKLTTNRLSELSPNMGMFMLRKDTSPESRWGLELGGQAGYDTDGQMPAMTPMKGADVMRYFSRANISYLAPVGNGLKFVGGLMSSFIGYESFYAKDNINYTRSWMCDYSPYFLIGGGALYPVNDQVDLGFYVVSDFNYLDYVNSQPKYAGQSTWRLTPQFKVMQNVFFGPQQENTAFQYWRGFSNTILEWAGDEYTVGLAYDIGSEKLAQSPSQVQSLWTGSALFTRWNFSGPWTVGLRPEVYWDPNGTMTGAIQTIAAITSTLEYKLNEGGMNGRFRIEYRYDNSSGTQGGFYGAGGVDGPLVAGQSTVFFALLVNYDQ